MSKARNEPALLIGAILAVALAASEFLIGWTPGADWTQPAGKAIAEGVAVLLGTGAIRQTVYGPKTVDEVMDAEAVIQAEE